MRCSVAGPRVTAKVGVYARFRGSQVVGLGAERGDSTEWRASRGRYEVPGVRTLLLLSFGFATVRAKAKGGKASLRQSGSAFGAAVYGTRERVPFLVGSKSVRIGIMSPDRRGWAMGGGGLPSRAASLAPREWRPPGVRALLQFAFRHIFAYIGPSGPKPSITNEGPRFE